MGDQFEDFINKHREHFEEDVDGASVWTSVENRLENKKSASFNGLWKVAAVLFLMTTIWLALDRSIGFSSEELSNTEMSSDWTQAEDFYTRLIAQKKQEILNFENAEFSQDLLTEIDNLDEAYNNLKKTYTGEISDEKVLNAMISNLQLRLRILNQQLMILQELKAKENEVHNNV